MDEPEDRQVTPYKQIIELIPELTVREQLALLSYIADRLRAGESKDQTDNEDSGITRRYFPRLPQMIEWGVIQSHERVYVHGHPNKPALLLNENDVAFNADVLHIYDWARDLKGWVSINIYEYVYVERTGKTLVEMRREYMDEHGIEYD